MNLEMWEDEFDDEVDEREVPGEWVLSEDEGLHVRQKGAQYTQRTFGRFLCSGCKRKWNSAEVHVIFFMTLNRRLQQGTVKMRIFKQECKKCSFPKMENPEISHENIVRIIKNLVNRILQVFYGKKKAKKDLKPEVYSKDMEGPHDKEHCEACKLMICRWTVSTKKPKPKKHNINEQYQSYGKTSSYVFTSTAAYTDYEEDYEEDYEDYAEDYSDYESESESTATYPHYNVNAKNEVYSSAATYTNYNVKAKNEVYSSTTTTYTNYNVKAKKEVYSSTTTYTNYNAKAKSEMHSSTSTYHNVQSAATYSNYNVKAKNGEYSLPATYTNYNVKPKNEVHSLPITYPNFHSTATYPNYDTNAKNKVYASPHEKESSTFPILTSIIAGIGVLALWYLNK